MYYGAMHTHSNIPRPSGQIDHALRSKVRALEEKIGRIELVNQVLWEMVQKSTGLTDADLELKIKDIDLRDGVDDDKITTVPLRCPSCKRVSSSRHWRCLYCGQEFERMSY